MVNWKITNDSNFFFFCIELFPLHELVNVHFFNIMIKTKGKSLLLQGVRREVGNHAKVLNKTLPLNTTVNSVPTQDGGRINSQRKKPLVMSESVESLLSEEANIFSPKATNGPLASQSKEITMQATQTQVSSGLGSNAEEGLERAANTSTGLKESIGHTEVEVAAGALLGFLIGLAVYEIM